MASTHGGVPEGVTVRRAQPADAPSYLAVYTRVAGERRFIRTERVRHGLRHYRRQFREPWTERHAWIVAVFRGRVIGAISLERLSHPVQNHIATLGMMVDAPWRGRGIGGALLDLGLTWARWAGTEKVTLEVYPTNPAAIALYRRFGFVEEGRMAGHSKKSYGYEDEILMSRWLIDPPSPASS